MVRYCFTRDQEYEAHGPCVSETASLCSLSSVNPPGFYGWEIPCRVLKWILFSFISIKSRSDDLFRDNLNLLAAFEQDFIPLW